MVCVAAFIVLAFSVLTVPIIKLFNRPLANSIISLFKKSLHCFSRRATFRACDTSFSDDVKNSLLKRVVLKRPSWVKPLSIAIEGGAVLMVLITIWSLLTAMKATVSLYVYDTCNPSTPSACSFDTTEACSIDAKQISFWRDPLGWTGNWFQEFGEAIVAVPSRLKHWDAEQYLPSVTSYYGGKQANKPLALDVFDPGCVICAQSFSAQKQAGFFNKYNVALLPYPISSSDSTGYKFANSGLITKYIIATELLPLADKTKSAAWMITERIYTGVDKDGVRYQAAFKVGYDAGKAERTLKQWLADFGYSQGQIEQLATLANSQKVNNIIKDNRLIVDNKIKTKKIPTMIFDGRRFDGQFEVGTKF